MEGLYRLGMRTEGCGDAAAKAGTFPGAYENRKCDFVSQGVRRSEKPEEFYQLVEELSPDESQLPSWSNRRAFQNREIWPPAPPLHFLELFH